MKPGITAGKEKAKKGTMHGPPKHVGSAHNRDLGEDPVLTQERKREMERRFNFSDKDPLNAPESDYLEREGYSDVAEKVVRKARAAQGKQGIKAKERRSWKLR